MKIGVRRLGAQVASRRAVLRVSASLLVLGMMATAAQAAPVLPQGGQFVAGAGTIGPAGAAGLVVNQLGARGVIDWRSFSIGAGGALTINNGAGVTLNRVTGGQASLIDGRLSATGSLYLINPQGVVVGTDGVVTAGGAVTLTTRDIANGPFMTGGALVASGRSPGDVTNQGTIIAQQGDVLLIGRSVVNTGLIQAANGAASLIAADSVVLAPAQGSGRIYVAPDAAASGDVTQGGQVLAASAALIAAGGNVYTLAGNRQGLIQAQGTTTIDGQVWLSAPNGTVSVAGEVDARDADGAGGKITAVGGRSTTISGTLDASGVRGGQVLVGVTAPGTDLSDATTLVSGAVIRAEGLSDGGVVETSGHALTIGGGSVTVGAGGVWTLDPTNLDITDTSALAATLAGGGAANATATGAITFDAALSWSTAATLTISAGQGLTINQAINGGSLGTLTGTAGGAISIGAAVSAHTVSLTTTSGALTISAGGVSASGVGGTVVLGTTGNFINSLGAGAVTAPTGGWWRVYSTAPTSDTIGGLTPDFYQYNTAVGAAPTDATHNGLIYSTAPVLSYSVIGSLSKVYDGGLEATGLTGSNISATGLITGDVIGSVHGGAGDVTGHGLFSQSNVGSSLTVTLNGVNVTRGGLPVYGYTAGSQQNVGVIGAITPAPLTVNLTGTVSKVYDTTNAAQLTGANFQILGVVGSDSIGIAPGPSTATYAGVDAGAHLLTVTLATTNYSASSGSLSNYSLPSTAANAGTFTGSITPFGLITQNIKALDKTYDGTATAGLSLGSATLIGVMNSDAVTLDTSHLAGVFHNGGLAGSSLQVDLSLTSGTGLTGAKAADYSLVLPTDVTASIARRALTLGGVTTADKSYDGNTTAALSFASAALSNKAAGDTTTAQINFDASAATGAFSQANVGSGLTVTVSGVTLTGSKAINYTLSPISVPTASITPRLLTVTLADNATTKVYDGTTDGTVDASHYTVTGWATGEGGSVTQTATATWASANAGTHDVSVTLEVADFTPTGSTAISNYYTTSPSLGVYSLHTALTSHSNVITPAPLTISIVGDPTKTYDGGTAYTGLTSANFNIAGLVNGEGVDINQTNGTFANPNAGNRAIQAVIGDSNFVNPTGGFSLSNYTYVSPVAGFGRITPAPLAGDLTVTIANKDKVYDGNTDVPTLVNSDFTLTGWQGADGADVTVDVSHILTPAAYFSKNAGVQGFSLTVDATQLGANDYSFYVSGGATNLGNYTLPTTLFGAGTISPKTLTATIIGGPTKIYDGTTLINPLSTSNYAISTGISGETITINQANGDFNSPNVTLANTVTATLNPSNFTISGTGALLSNYTLPTTASGAGTITVAPLHVINAFAADKVYDGTDAAALVLGAASLQGVVTGDTVGLTLAAGATFPSIHVGAGYTVTPATPFGLSGAALTLSNYQLFQPTLTAGITPLALTVSGAAATSRAYTGLTGATVTGTGLSTLVAADVGVVTLDASGATGVFEQANVGTGLKVTASGFALSGDVHGDYTLVQPTGLTADITPAQLSGAIINNPTKTYDGTTQVNLGSTNFQITGWQNGEGATVTNAASSAYGLADAGVQDVTANLQVSNFVANSGTRLSNYYLPGGVSQSAGTITTVGGGTINRAPLTAQIINNPTRVYNQAFNYDATTTNTGVNAGIGLTSSNYALLGFVSGQGATVSQTDAVFNNANVGVRTLTATLAGGDFTATGSTNLNNYILPGSASGAGTITPFALSFSGATAQNKVYDRLTTAVMSVSGTVPGTFAGDTITVAGTAGVFSDKNVNTGKTVTCTNCVLSGVGASNYSLIAPTALADITPAPVTVRVTKTYDGTNDAGAGAAGAPVYAVFGKIAGDSLTVDGSAATGTYSSSHVADVHTTPAVTLTGEVLGGADAGNYAITGVTGVINKAALTITGAVADNKVYDATTAAVIDNTGSVITGLKGSDAFDITFTTNGGATVTTVSSATLTSGVFASPDVANGIAVSFASGAAYGVALGAGSTHGEELGDYTLSQPSYLQANITKATLSFTGGGAKVQKVYDGTNALPTSVNVNNLYVLSGILNNDSVFVSSATGTFSGIDVSNSLNINIDPASVVLSGTKAGDYQIDPTTAISGIGVITPRTVNLSAVGVNKVYDATTAATVTGAAFAARSGDTGVIAADVSSGRIALTNATTGVFANKNVGDGKTITTSFGLTGAANAAGDYVIIQPTVTANITPVTLTLSGLVANNKVYDGTTTATLSTSAASIASGVLAGDVVSLTQSASAGIGLFDTRNVGVGKTVTATYGAFGLAGADAGNYLLGGIAALSANITPRPLTATGALATSKVYDGTTADPLNLASVALQARSGNVGYIPGDAVILSSAGATGLFSDPNAANGKIVTGSGFSISGADAANYLFTQPTGMLANITPKPITAAIVGDPTKTYDGTTRANLTPANFLLTGFIGSDGALVTRTLGAYDVADSGARTVSATLGTGDFNGVGATLLSNYALPTSAVGPGHINPITGGDLFIRYETNLVQQGAAVTSDANAVIREIQIDMATPRVYIPFPAPGALSTWKGNGFGSLPIVLDQAAAYSVVVSDLGDVATQSGPPMINNTEQVLLQGVRSKQYRIIVPTQPIPRGRASATIRRLGAAALAAALLAPLAALAQAPSGSTPGQNTGLLAPKLPAAPAAPSVTAPGGQPGSRAAAGPEAAKPFIDSLKGLVFVAGTAALIPEGLPADAAGPGGVAAPQLPLLSDPRFVALMKAHLGKPVRLADLQQIRDQTKTWYIGQQRPFVDVAAPPQNISSGVIQIVVSEYRLGEVDEVGARYFKKSLILAPVDLKAGQTITLSQLQDNVNRLNENPFLSIDAEFAPGKAPGTTDLTLRAKDRLPVRVYAGYDNQGVPSLDVNEWEAGINWGNVFGTGQIASYQYTRAMNGRFTSHSLTDVVRLDNTSKFLAFANYGIMRSGAFLGPFAFDSNGHTFQVSVRYVKTLPKLFGGAVTGHVQLGYDYKTTDNNAFFDQFQLGPPSRMETHQFPLVVDLQEVDRFGQTAIENDLVGAPGRLSARDNDADFQTLVAGARARYVYDRLQVTRTQHLPKDVSLIVRAILQRSDAILPNSEQLGGGGVGSARGYYPDTGLGSNGELLSAELRSPAFSPGRYLGLPKLDDLAQVGLFWDYASLRQPYYPIDALTGRVSNGQQPLDLASTGVLLHYSISRHIDFNMDMGWQLRRAPNQSRLGDYAAVALVVSN